jgi:hypothetical protein
MCFVCIVCVVCVVCAVQAGGSSASVPIFWLCECGIPWKACPHETAASQAPVAGPFLFW